MAKAPLVIRDKTVFDGRVVKSFLKFIIIYWFKLRGWKTTPSAPEGAGITIAAPHTSNWDIIYALGAAIINDVKIYFSIKESWCRVPVIGALIMWFGAIPINRSGNGQGQVKLIKAFVERHRNERIFFLFTPEGTRGKVDKWKTGFYHVAEETGLPIFLAQVDYRTKTSGVFHSYQLSGNKDADIKAIQASYSRICGRYPQDQYPPYTGPLPSISEKEAAIMKAIYSLKEAATQAEIAAKTKFESLSSDMLDYLIEKGILEKVIVLKDGKQVSTYRLTISGNGCLLHLTPSLSH